MSELRAWVVDRNFAMDTVEVVMGRRISQDAGEYVTAIYNGQCEFVTVPLMEQVPSISIPSEIARSLFEALTVHFGGSTSTQQLRADYDSERKRVDKLTDAVLKVITRE